MTPVSFAATHRGTVRPHNEDAYVDVPERGLWAVADGAGGHAAGEVASGMLADALGRMAVANEPDDALTQIRATVAAVHAGLREEALRRGDSIIASTLVVLLLRAGHFAVLWCGDSRAYLLRGGVLTQVTRDHSLVQALVDQGAITPEQAEGHPQANVIIRAVGASDDSAELDKALGDIVPGDSFLLCSDGLSKVLDDVRLAALMQEPDPAAALLDAALQAGARDNVTALVVTTDHDETYNRSLLADV
nr:protein phosphatase 2C domain-containing protein [uncultured Lichenicoccus sp.]